MPITHTINEPSSPIGMPTEAVAMSLCDTRAALEALLAAVQATVRLNEEMLEALGGIAQAITEGTEKANEGIAAASEHRQELQLAIEELRGHKECMSELRTTVQADVDERVTSRGNNGDTRP